ncbi:MAG: SufE family protein [Bacteroidales bacterium]|nr:SufE family protein [Bacteroidales bacterium]
MTVNKKQQEIVEEFALFDDWMDKYNYLIELSKELPEMDPREKTEENLIEGCQSKVWLHAEMDGDKLVFRGDSDAIITKGLVALLIKVLSGRKPEEIKDADLYFIDEIGLRENLSPTRSNGLLAMINKMKAYAMAYELKQNQ